MSQAFNIYKMLNDIIPKDISEIIIKKICVNRMRKYLKSIGLDPDTIFKQLRDYKCVISGSFPLMCLLDKLPKPFTSDIDIYGLYDKSDKDRSTKYRSMYPIHEFEENLYKDIKSKWGAHGHHEGYSTLKIEYLRDYYTRENDGSEYKIQFISTQIDPTKFIAKIFDLSFCKIIFDGNNLFVDRFEDTIQKKGILSNVSKYFDYLPILKDVINEGQGLSVPYFNEIDYISYEQTEIEKYKQHTFIKFLSKFKSNIVRDNVFFVIPEDYVAFVSQISRIIKYINRGFKIVI